MTEETAIYPPSKCAWCDGSGEWNVAPGICASCIVCGGKGSVKVAQPPIVCSQCEGKGRIYTVTPCVICAGTGWESYLTKQKAAKNA